MCIRDRFESLIGDGFKKDATELEKLGAFVNDEAVLQKILDVKNAKKAELKDYLAKTQGIELNENSIYDIQIKRLHEYKRQQMNALYVIHKYFEIKAGKKPARPITVISVSYTHLAKAKNTVLTRSSRWGCLWTVMGYLLLFHFSPATQMNRLP